MADGLGALKILVAGIAITAAFGFGASLASPSLSDEFRQAASVGQLTQKQAVNACQTAEAELNSQSKAARGENKFAPEQNVSFHCADAAVTTKPPATLAPAGQ